MQSNLVSTPLFLKLKKIQGLFKDLHRNSRTFQGKMEFKDFSRTPPKIQGLFKTVRTLVIESEKQLELVTHQHGKVPSDGIYYVYSSGGHKWCLQCKAKLLLVLFNSDYEKETFPDRALTPPCY